MKHPTVIAGEDLKKFDVAFVDAKGLVHKVDPTKPLDHTTLPDLKKHNFMDTEPEQSTLTRQVGGDHYKRLKIQPWEVIDAWGLDFYLGNAVKRIARNKIGQDRIEDLEKLIHEIEHEIELLRAQQGIDSAEAQHIPNGLLGPYHRHRT